MTIDATFAQAASAAAWIALTLFLLMLSVCLVVAIGIIVKAWKKITKQIEQDDARIKKEREEWRRLKW